ncbi:unnamed protein product, partial [Symbiodinium sp. CCMP2592]
MQMRSTAGFLSQEFRRHARSIAASSSRRSDGSGAVSSQGDGALESDQPSIAPTGDTSDRAATPPPPSEDPPPPPSANQPPEASEEAAKEGGDDEEMEDDSAGQEPKEDDKMGDGEEQKDEVPGKAPPSAARTTDNPPEHGVRSRARGPPIDVRPASTAADQAANDPKKYRIEGPGIKATTIHRPDQMPQRGIDSISPIVQYEMNSVPVALPEFVVPGLDVAVDDSVNGRLVAATCLPPTDEQRKYSRHRFAMFSSNQTMYLNVALHKKPAQGDHDSFLRPETYEECRDIHDAGRAYSAREQQSRSIGGSTITCNRLLNDDAQSIPPARVPDEAMTNLVRKLMFRVVTQTKEYPTTIDPAKKSDDR